MFKILVLREMLMLLVSCIAFFIILRYVWHNRKLYKISYQLPGPIALPIIGNGLIFAGNPADSFDKIVNIFNSYPTPSRVWLGPKLVLIFANVEHVEKLFPSTKLIDKSYIYRFIRDYIPHNLVSESGKIWKDQRKLVQHLTTLQYVYTNIEVMQLHIDKLIEKLRKHSGGPHVEIYDTVHYCAFDIIIELIFGINPDTQANKEIPFMKCMLELYYNSYEQMTKPWLHVDFIFNATKLRKRREYIQSVLNEFTYKAIDQAMLRIKEKDQITTTDPLIDQICKVVEANPDLLTKEHIVGILITVVFASSDTIAIVAAGACCCLGINKEYQKLAVEEMINTFGNKHRFSFDQISKLKYLDMCIKESLRLFPIAPLILRKSCETINIDNLEIPPGCEVLLSIHSLHYNPQYWQHPNLYYPDHFLPDAVKSRNKYAFVPFSSGPRSCSGQHLGMQVSKLIVAKLLQNFEVEADGKVSDIRLALEITLRFRDGLMVKFKDRQ